MAFNRKQRLRDNIEAIRTAFLLDREGRTPTEAERDILRSYCGFGGLKCILNRRQAERRGQARLDYPEARRRKPKAILQRN